MTKKHYEAIASKINKERLLRLEKKQTGALASLYFLSKDLADYFVQDNPRFDRARFLQACGIEQ